MYSLGKDALWQAISLTVLTIVVITFAWGMISNAMIIVQDVLDWIKKNLKGD